MGSEAACSRPHAGILCLRSEGDERRPLQQQQPVHLHALGQCEDRAASLSPALGQQQVPLPVRQFPQHTRLIGALLPLGLVGAAAGSALRVG